MKDSHEQMLFNPSTPSKAPTSRDLADDIFAPKFERKIEPSDQISMTINQVKAVKPIMDYQYLAYEKRNMEILESNDSFVEPVTPNEQDAIMNHVKKNLKA